MTGNVFQNAPLIERLSSSELIILSEVSAKDDALESVIDSIPFIQTSHSFIVDRIYQTIKEQRRTSVQQGVVELERYPLNFNRPSSLPQDEKDLWLEWTTPEPSPILNAKSIGASVKYLTNEFGPSLILTVFAEIEPNIIDVCPVGLGIAITSSGRIAALHPVEVSGRIFKEVSESHGEAQVLPEIFELVSPILTSLTLMNNGVVNFIKRQEHLVIDPAPALTVPSIFLDGIDLGF